MSMSLESLSVLSTETCQHLSDSQDVKREKGPEDTSVIAVQVLLVIDSF